MGTERPREYAARVMLPISAIFTNVAIWSNMGLPPSAPVTRAGRHRRDASTPSSSCEWQAGGALNSPVDEAKRCLLLLSFADFRHDRYRGVVRTLASLRQTRTLVLAL